MSDVALVKCDSYDNDRVKEAVIKGIDLLGGIGNFVKKREKIILKPNFISSARPEKCVTTHPSIFKAISELLIEHGVIVSYGDSPGFLSTKEVAKKAGFIDIANEIGLKLENFVEGKEINYKDGKQSKKFVIAKSILESDGIISLPKIKTHGFQKLTCCIKNQLGCVPGILKVEFHVKFPDANDFAKMLVDLDFLIKPRLYIVDGIYAMEGNGPFGGNPKKLGILLFGTDPVAIDATICRIINIDPELVPTIKYGKEFGRGEYEENKIKLLGYDIDDFIQRDFDIDRSKIISSKKGSLFSFLINRVVSRPVIDNSKCVKCGVCINICPVNPKALNWKNNNKTKSPVYDYKKCIRCYCCQEVCPHSAITIKKPLLNKIFSIRDK
jgi:uncharacterized protein (DUF362 family)/NAD-dependent dihydropyrimidine dehydrogenase PreA subunit